MKVTMADFDDVEAIIEKTLTFLRQYASFAL